MEKVSSAHGKLDILVNAAAIEIEKTIEETSLDEWNRIFAINVTGTFLVSKYAMPLMREAVLCVGNSMPCPALIWLSLWAG